MLRNSSDGREAANSIGAHGLRLLAILTVMTGHWSDQHFARLIPQGQLAVDMLIAVEGWLAASTFHRPVSPSNWIAARFWHVYPMYALALALGGCAIWLSLSDQLLHIPPNLMSSAFFSGLLMLPAPQIPSLSGALFPLNWPSWAVVLEFWVLALLVGTRVFASTRTIAALTALGAMGVIVAAVLWRDVNVGWRGEHFVWGPLRVLYDVGAGILLQRLQRRRLWPKLPLSVPAVWIVAAACLELTLPHVGLPLLLFAVPALTAAALQARPMAGLSAIPRVSQRYGLAFYLLHFPLLVAWHAMTRRAGCEQAMFGSALGYGCSLALAGTATVVGVRMVEHATSQAVRFTGRRLA